MLVLGLLLALLPGLAAAQGFGAARTNIVLQSEDFSTTWANGNTAETVDAIAAPDGAVTADAVTSAATATDVFLIVQSDIPVAGSQVYTMSVFLKQGVEGEWVYLAHVDQTAGAEQERAWFNLSTGAKGTSNNSPLGYDIQDAGSGWYRVWMSFNTQAGESTMRFRVYKASGDGATTDATTSGNILYYIWGGQLEAGVGPSPYIQTTTASASRQRGVFGR